MNNFYKRNNIITEHTGLSQEEKIKAQIARLALFAGMRPEYKEGETGRFVHFSNGRQCVQLKNKNLKSDEVISRLIQICKAAGLDVTQTLGSLIQNKGAFALQACDRVQNQISKNYEASVSVGGRTDDEVEKILYMIDKNTKQFESTARAVGLDYKVVVGATKQIAQDIKDVQSIREQNSAAEFGRTR